MKEKNQYVTVKILWYLLPAAFLLPFLQIWLQKSLYGGQFSLFDWKNIFIPFIVATIWVGLIILMYVFMHSIEYKWKRREKLSQALVGHRRGYALFMLDEAGKITSWNTGTERLTGYRSNEVLGKDFSFLYLEKERKSSKIQEILEEVKEKKQLENEGWRCHKSGRKFWAITTMTAHFDKNNHLLGYTKLMRDATRQKETDEKLKNLIERLEHSNQELERFAYIASHDLQEPLRMVASFTQLLAKKYSNQLDKEAQDYINFAVDGALRMQQLIVNLLAYSRISTHAQTFVRTNLQMVIQNAIDNLSVIIHETHASVFYGENLPTVSIDRVQLIEVFQNFIMNAIKFRSKEDPIISISVTRQDQDWLISIQDNGIGIAPEYHEEIFLIFQRLHLREEYQGMGMGLSICKKIIERHGGRVWVESEPGKGAKFCFTLPK